MELGCLWNVFKWDTTRFVPHLKIRFPSVNNQSCMTVIFVIKTSENENYFSKDWSRSRLPLWQQELEASLRINTGNCVTCYFKDILGIITSPWRCTRLFDILCPLNYLYFSGVHNKRPPRIIFFFLFENQHRQHVGEAFIDEANFTKSGLQKVKCFAPKFMFPGQFHKRQNIQYIT